MSKDILNDILNIYPHLNPPNEKTFQKACAEGNLIIARVILKINPSINISADNECAFRMACENDHIAVAQWLLSVKPDIDISADDNYAFLIVLENGHIEIAKWLLSIKPEISQVFSLAEDIIFEEEMNELGEIDESEETKLWLESLLPPKSVEEIDVCPICLDAQSDKITSCRHQFCASCIVKSRETNKSCPCCRQKYILFPIKLGIESS